MWYIPGLYFPSPFFIYQVYTWYILGISFQRAESICPATESRLECTFTQILACKVFNVHHRNKEPMSARAAAAIATAADSDSEAEAGAQGFSPFSLLLLRGLLLLLNRPGRLASFGAGDAAAGDAAGAGVVPRLAPASLELAATLLQS